MKNWIKILAAIIIVSGLGFAGLVGYATLTDYKPPPDQIVHQNQSAPALEVNEKFRLMIWNIGYAGLSENMDFFYDGGKQVRPSKAVVDENISAIEKVLKGQDTIDFFLLQEVDQHSKRSYYTNEYLKIAALFPDFFSSFGKNYDVFFVPIPISNPLGKVLSGLQTLSRFEPITVVRHSFPGNYKWPKGLFMLDRCFMVSRFKLAAEKELVVINTHNSAYDDGMLRSRQMDFMGDFLTDEYQKGNYIIVGGDWNQCPPKFVNRFKKNIMDNRSRMDISKDFMPGWSWAFDNTVPTNRRLPTPYDEKTSLTTVIDFYLVSPNIEVKAVKGIHRDFRHSDHQPVVLEVALKR